MSEHDHDDDDDMQIDQWDNTIGDDAELATIWCNLGAAVGTGKPAEVEQQLGAHLASLGPRWRRIGEALIYAAAEASVQPPKPGVDWRVTLHRHFIRDRPLDLGEATERLLAFKASGGVPDWHSMPEQVPLRLLCSYVRDLRAAAEAVGPAAGAAATLYELASEMFDFSMILPADDVRALSDDPDVAAMMTDILRVIADSIPRTQAGRGSDAEKARALVEVTLKQLGITSAVIH
jgi:hypothetical protein